jgi:type IV secretion system protein VirD4
MIAQSWAFLNRLMLLLAVMLASLGVAWIVRLYPFATLIGLAAVVWHQSHRFTGSRWSHGTAKMASSQDLLRGGMLCDSGLTLGTTELVNRPGRLSATLGLISPLRSGEQACRCFLAAWFGSAWQANRFIRIQKFVHVATFAKTGGGKGVGLIVPNLLSYGLSVVVIDIKGELYKITADHRKRRLKHKIIRLDPLGIAGPVAESACINPLDYIDESSDSFLDQCRELAGQLVVKTGKEQDQHWVESARLVLTAFIAFVCGCESDRSKRTLNTVRMFVSSRVAFANAITIMQQETAACEGVIARLGNLLTWYVDRELGSVLTTVQRFTEFLDSPSIQRHTASSSFDPRILRSGKVSIYLCLPHDKVESLAPLQRMWISTIMRVIAKDGTGETDSVLFILDEAAHLGRVEAIEQGVTLLRGMGIRLWFAFQSLGQVKEVFGEKASTILDNIGTQQYFCVSSFESAEAISKRVGETTIAIQTFNESFSRSRSVGSSSPSGQQPGNVSTSSSRNYSDMARSLIRPEEIMTMDEDMSLLFHNNLPVVATRLIKYYEHPAFRRGGIGKPRRLGLAAGVASACLLVLSVAFIDLAHNLPTPSTLRQMVAMPTRGQDTLMPYWGQPRYRPSPAVRRRVSPPRYRYPAYGGGY